MAVVTSCSIRGNAEHGQGAGVTVLLFMDFRGRSQTKHLEFPNTEEERGERDYGPVRSLPGLFEGGSQERHRLPGNRGTTKASSLTPA